MKVDEEILIDMIPLAEVKSVKAMNEAEKERPETFGPKLRKKGAS